MHRYYRLHVFCSIFICLVLGCVSDDDGLETTIALEGKVFPPSDYNDVVDSNGMSVDLNDYQGKIVLLNFWATWCGPCRIEIPALVKLRSEYESSEIAVIGVSLDRGPSEQVQKMLGEFIDRYNINYPIILDKNGSLVKKVVGGSVQSLGIPMTFIFDRQGRIYAKHIGVPRGRTGLDPYGIIKKDIEAML